MEASTLNRVLALLTLVALVGCGGGSSNDGGNPSTPTDPGMLVIEDLVVGTGDEAVVGNVVTVHYVGALTNGQVFEASNYTYSVGAGQVIRGWDQGVPGMRVGGTRRLTIPPSLAYGNQAVGPIPPNSTLIFDIELLSIDS